MVEFSFTFIFHSTVFKLNCGALDRILYDRTAFEMLADLRLHRTVRHCPSKI